MVNTMRLCYAKDRSDAVIFRVFGEGIDYMLNQKQQIAATKLFHEIGISPIIHCIFKNGICMEFVKGTSFGWSDLSGIRDIKICK